MPQRSAAVLSVIWPSLHACRRRIFFCSACATQPRSRRTISSISAPAGPRQRHIQSPRWRPCAFPNSAPAGRCLSSQARPPGAAPASASDRGALEVLPGQLLHNDVSLRHSKTPPWRQAGGLRSARGSTPAHIRSHIPFSFSAKDGNKKIWRTSKKRGIETNGQHDRRKHSDKKSPESAVLSGLLAQCGKSAFSENIAAQQIPGSEINSDKLYQSAAMPCSFVYLSQKRSGIIYI